MSFHIFQNGIDIRCLAFSGDSGSYKLMQIAYPSAFGVKAIYQGPVVQNLTTALVNVSLIFKS